ncbi:MAG: hypothetical protein JXB39_07440 [Deltaproteobacteria bacterium]|nr:hypothetical protein [Deltaproteobacteria bacterium]
MEQAKATREVAEADIQTARLDVKVLEAELDLARAQLEYEKALAVQSAGGSLDVTPFQAALDQARKTCDETKAGQQAP